MSPSYHIVPRVSNNSLRARTLKTLIYRTGSSSVSILAVGSLWFVVQVSLNQSMRLPTGTRILPYDFNRIAVPDKPAERGTLTRLNNLILRTDTG